MVRAADGRRRLATIRWGLIPFWAKEPDIGHRLINARSETARTKPSFRSAWRSRRCLIPVDGFYEWTGEKKARQPWLIAMTGGGVFCLAGLWERWIVPAGLTLTGSLAELHETLVLAEASPHQGWFKTRETAVGELLLAGWPVVVGPDPNADRGGLVRSPLLTADAQLGVTAGIWTLRTPAAGVSLNPYALDLLGLSRNSRDEVVAAVGASLAVQEASTPAAPAIALADALEEEGLDDLEELDSAALSPVADAIGIHLHHFCTLLDRASPTRTRRGEKTLTSSNNFTSWPSSTGLPARHRCRHSAGPPPCQSRRSAAR